MEFMARVQQKPQPHWAKRELTLLLLALYRLSSQRSGFNSVMKLFSTLAFVATAVFGGSDVEIPQDRTCLQITRGIVADSVGYFAPKIIKPDLPDVAPPVAVDNGVNVYSEITSDKLQPALALSLIHISEPTRQAEI